MSINPLLPNRPLQGQLVPRATRLSDLAAVGSLVAASPATTGLTLPAVITSQSSLTTVVVQRGMTFRAQVTWAKTVDTTTDWTSSDSAIASVVVDATDTTTATVTANDDTSGVVEISAAANAGAKEQTATIEVCVVAGGIPQGSISID